MTTLDRLAGTHNESVVTVAFVERLATPCHVPGSTDSTVRLLNIALPGQPEAVPLSVPTRSQTLKDLSSDILR